MAMERPVAMLLCALPPDIIVYISQFLEEPGVACLALACKRNYDILSMQVSAQSSEWRREFVRLDRRLFSQSMRWRNNFLRLLERDLPSLILCDDCQVLVPWQTNAKSEDHLSPPTSWKVGNDTGFATSDLALSIQSIPQSFYRLRYDCPREPMHRSRAQCIRWCPAHGPNWITRHMAHAYLRGHERGPLYGPQLFELTHTCSRNSCHTSREARIAHGILVTRTTHRMLVSIPPESFAGEPQLVEKRITPEILVPIVKKFVPLGCRHGYYSLPAIVIDGIRLHTGYPRGSLWTTKSQELISCADCTTDLRLLISDIDKNSHLVEIKLIFWRSLGSRVVRTPRSPREWRIRADWQSQRSQVLCVRFQAKELIIHDQPESFVSLEDLYDGRIVKKDGCLEFCDNTLRARQYMQWWTWKEATDPHCYPYEVPLGLGPPVGVRPHGVGARPG
jgi:hypothetical protein